MSSPDVPGGTEVGQGDTGFDTPLRAYSPDVAPGTTATDVPQARFAAEVQETPLWLRSVHAALPVTSQFVVHGGIRDLHAVPGPYGIEFLETSQAIWQVLAANGFDALISWSPLDSAVVVQARGGWAPTAQVTQAVGLGRGPANAAQDPFAGLAEAIDFVQTTQDARLALAIDYVSQVISPEEDPNSGLGRAMLSSLRNVHRYFGATFSHPERREAVRHPVFWLVDQPNDLPHWMLSGDGIRQLPIGMPELDTRATVAQVFAPPGASADFGARFADATEGLSIKAMMDAAGFIHPESDGQLDVEAAVRAYRVGVSQNPWRNQQLREKLRSGVGILERRVKGQGRATQRVLDLLMRSAMGLTAAHQAKPGSGVRGVLYFAGATGVGKTEMAKAIAELVFGREEALIRFDMSEFSHEGSEGRLIGAPPGYIGHSSGGELTNAVRQRPFSVVLFDEIDKAHGRILDKFLQILSDGRLTDGSGDTVFFTDTIIIFTSNQGVVDTEGIDTNTDAGQVAYDKVIRQAVEDFFTHQLNRPELLGRIGDNIVAFRPITDAVGATLAETFIANILSRVAAASGHRVTLTGQVRKQLIAMATSDLSKGGRGIGLTLESVFVNPLARALFLVPAGAPTMVTALGRDAEGNPTVVVGPT